MTGLIRYELTFNLAIAYFQDNLLNTNTLSSKLIDLVSFKSGIFFTLLPSGINIKNINHFKHGGIAIGVKKVIGLIIFEHLVSNPRFYCVFDDATSSWTKDYKEPVFLSCGVVYNHEIYYLLTPQTASKDLVDKCIYNSESIWHSLCVLSEFHSNFQIGDQISLEDIEKICLNARLIVINAYDGEGYVFWERANSRETVHLEI
jgi:hypothetical protein